ncbi:MAG TPA: molybdopterin-dependent oxidoreductase [Bryobacteraceae bacterium]|nr:molybdopterin-dependent oxidoreductase [Bryobacteraceae bacterium]
MTLSRRNFFALAAGTALFAQDRAKVGMKVLSQRPEDLEMPLSSFGDYITPIEHFFVRTHVYVPTVDLKDWRLAVDGEVATPLTLTMDDLKKLPSVELVSVVECAGNGRSFTDPPVPGLQWSSGSVGNGRWRGVRLADLLRRAGIKDSGVDVLFNGADVPIGTMQDFRRSIPVKKALDSNTLLAYEMNGATLPVKHGFPLRVVAPGWASDSWVKWLINITVLDKEFDGFWMKSAYRKPDHPIAPGSAMAPDKMIPVTSLKVKSVIASPLDGAAVKLGEAVAVKGVAWSGDRGPIASVDVSTDGGRSWKTAQLGPEKSQFGWRQWAFSFRPERESYYNIMARATDASGDTQPFVAEWNPSGYGWNVVPRVGVNVLENPPQGGPDVLQPGISYPQDAGYKDTCLTCHEEDVIRQQRLTRAQWDREITKMTNWGAPVKPGNRESILNYLSRYFGPGPR